MPGVPEESPSIVQIEQLLRAIHPEPGERFHQRMARAPWKVALSPSEGAFKMHWNYRFVALTVVTLILAAMLMATPAGSVFAHEILQFFARLQGNTLALPPDQIFEPVPSATPEPTHALALQPANQVAQTALTATTTPTLVLSPDEWDDLSLVEAEAVVGFDLYEPIRLPRDYRLTRIFYDPKHRAVSMQYASPRAGSGEFFQITEGRNLEPLSVGAGAKVETVVVEGNNAEFVRGSWFVANGAGQATWKNESGVYTLRWQVDKVTISIEFFLNEDFSPAYLERDEMLAVARNLTRCASTSDYDCKVSQAAAAAGFTPWQFPAAPDGLSFQGADYRPGLTALQYGSGMAQLTVLQSRQDFTSQEKAPWFSVPAEAVESVIVSWQPGEYVQGQFMARPGEAEAVWDPDAPVERLRWKNSSWWFQIVNIGAPFSEAQQLADLAGQLSEDAVQVQVGRQPDSHLESSLSDKTFTSIADLESLAGFDVREPDLLPEGLSFSHARYEPFSGSVMLFYGSFAQDKYHADGPVLIIGQTQRAKIDSYVGADYPSEALQSLDVNGYPGQLITGMMVIGPFETGQPTPTPAWEPESGVLILTWKTETMTYVIQFNPSGQGARMTSSDLLGIAQSLR